MSEWIDVWMDVWIVFLMNESCVDEWVNSFVNGKRYSLTDHYVKITNITKDNVLLFTILQQNIMQKSVL